MLIGVDRNNKRVLVQDQIEYVHIESYVNGHPITVEVGVIEDNVSEHKLIKGKTYTLVGVRGDVLKAKLNKIDPTKGRIDGEKFMAIEFLPTSAYKLENNEYEPTQKAYGAKLKNYVKGNTNQHDVAKYELRKKGLVHKVEGMGVKQVHVKETKKDKKKYLAGVVSTTRFKGKSTKKNYSTVESGEKSHGTKGGGTAPVYDPNATKQDMKGLSQNLSPVYLVWCNDENYPISIGSTVVFRGEKYGVMEKQTTYRRERVNSFFVLGK